jgi:hypothetical protein
MVRRTKGGTSHSNPPLRRMDAVNKRREDMVANDKKGVISLSESVFVISRMRDIVKHTADRTIETSNRALQQLLRYLIKTNLRLPLKEKFTP